jgi:predicted nucleic acid-binding protein
MTGNSFVADTNIFIDLMKGETAIAQKLELFTEVYLSPIVLAELYFGAYRSDSPEKHLSKIVITISKQTLGNRCRNIENIC